MDAHVALGFALPFGLAITALGSALGLGKAVAAADVQHQVALSQL